MNMRWFHSASTKNCLPERQFLVLAHGVILGKLRSMIWTNFRWHETTFVEKWRNRNKIDLASFIYSTMLPTVSVVALAYSDYFFVTERIGSGFSCLVTFSNKHLFLFKVFEKKET